jgi:hypothetical protein
MNLNGKCARLLDGLTAEKGVAWNSLSEESHPVHVAKACDQLRRWLGIANETGGLRPSDTLLAVVLGHGREGLLRLIGGFIEETARTDQEAAAILGGMATLVRRARAMRLLDWSIDDVKPETARGRPRMLVELSPDVDEQLRAAVLARGESLRQFTEDALRERLAKLAGRPRRHTGSRAGATTTATQ